MSSRLQFYRHRANRDVLLSPKYGAGTFRRPLALVPSVLYGGLPDACRGGWLDMNNVSRISKQVGALVGNNSVVRNAGEGLI